MSDIILSWKEHTLEFIKPAKTSRGEYANKKVFLISLRSGNAIGSGEASPLPDLSIDGQANISQKLEELKPAFLEGENFKDVINTLKIYPSLQFALECAWLGLQSGGSPLFDTAYTQKREGIRINGLIWMDSIEAMETETINKINSGFHCIKFKIGTHEHDEECRLLERIRKKYSAFKLEIRLDANGAYAPDDARQVLKDLSRFEIHSIEQPIKAGQWDLMAQICAESPIPIALDEELIGIEVHNGGSKMLKTIRPAYIILKPTLLGGFSNCDAWIEIADSFGTGWWATSALESNIGLGHIAQWVSSKSNPLPQGLGTGALFRNNFPPTTNLKADILWFDPPNRISE